MATLTLLRQSLAEKRGLIERAEHRFNTAPVDAIGWLRNRLAENPFVLFCGAGISVAPPTSAPTFLELRKAVILALADLLIERQMIVREDLCDIESALEQLDGRQDIELPPELA